jgi:hypothetical protein
VSLCLEKNPLQKRTGGVAQGIGLEFKLQYCKKKKIHPFKVYTSYVLTVELFFLL